jgi:hypothetical protein
MKQVTASGVDERDEKGSDALLVKMQDEHKDFAISFPIPLRWIVQARQYRRDAFAKFLLFYKKATMESSSKGTVFSSKQRFLEVQAEYLVFLRKALDPKRPASEYKAFRKEIVESLVKESERFEKIRKEVDEEFKKEQAVADKKRRDDLYNILLASRLEAKS